MNIYEFIKKYKKLIKNYIINGKEGDWEINYSEMKMWVENDEYLYNLFIENGGIIE